MYLKPSGIGLDWPGLLVVAWAVWPQLVGGQALPGTYLASTLTQAGAGDTNQLATSCPADHSKQWPLFPTKEHFAHIASIDNLAQVI